MVLRSSEKSTSVCVRADGKPAALTPATRDQPSGSVVPWWAESGMVGRSRDDGVTKQNYGQTATAALRRSVTEVWSIS